MAQLNERFNKAPVSIREYEIAGKKFIVTRHFAGNKNVQAEIKNIAFARAKREMKL